jgi:ribose-phosphate pyrophosphokinase
MHADQLQGFFDVPVDNLQALPLFGWYIKKRLFKKFYEQGTQSQHLAVLSPDEGSSKLAKAAASYLGVPLARRGKERDKFTDSSGEVKSEELNIGFNIEGRHILVFDDQMDTGGTLISSTKDLKETYGASSVWFLPTHLVASPKESPGQPLTAEEKLQNASSKPKLITTDTVYRSDEYIKQNSSWLHCVLSMAPFFGETIYRQINAMSVSIMYNKPEIFESILDQAFTEENFNYYNRESSQSELTKFLDT